MSSGWRGVGKGWTPHTTKQGQKMAAIRGLCCGPFPKFAHAIQGNLYIHSDEKHIVNTLLLPFLLRPLVFNSFVVVSLFNAAGPCPLSSAVALEAEILQFKL